MRILTVPNWSFGREASLVRDVRDRLDGLNVKVHYCQADLDHNRTVTAFSGEAGDVFDAVSSLCELILDRIDLNRHTGVHPRIGALDVCPFVLLDDEHNPVALNSLKLEVEAFADRYAEAHGIPVFLYERSESGRHEADLPSLRRGGFGSLLGRELRPDFGPNTAHPRLGITIMGVRDFLVAFNVNLHTEELLVAREIARRIRTLRLDGDERFLGVRALGFPLVSRNQTQVSLNLTLPDLTSADPIIEWIWHLATEADVKVAEAELVGVIRERDLAGATRLPIRPEQVVDRVAPEI